MIKSQEDSVSLRRSKSTASLFHPQVGVGFNIAIVQRGFAIVNSGINTRQSGESVVRSVVSQVPEEGAREGRVMTLTIDVIRRALFLDHCHRRTLISFLEPRTIRFDPDFFKKSERGGKKREKMESSSIESFDYT